MVGSRPHHEESVGSQCQDHFLNLKWMRDRKVSVHITHTSRSHSRSGSHVSHGKDTRNMQLEIDHLQRKLRSKRWRGTPSRSESPSKDDNDDNYKPRSRTPPSESFCRNKSPSCKGLGNDAMSRVLNQIFKSPFTCRIKWGKLPRRLTQPTFTMYNSRIDLVEHVSHFNQWMTVHSKNTTLMYKVFPSSLGPVVMRWFDGLKEGSINSFKELTRAFVARFVTCSRVPWPFGFPAIYDHARGENPENVF